jgi:hypothetical protein
MTHDIVPADHPKSWRFVMAVQANDHQKSGPFLKIAERRFKWPMSISQTAHEKSRKSL